MRRSKADTYKVTVTHDDDTVWSDYVVNITGGLAQATKRAATMLDGKYGRQATFKQIQVEEYKVQP